MTAIWTIGHSTRPIEEFIGLLSTQGITRLVDIRTVPKSRRNPQYWHDALAASLGAAGIGYTYLEELGGLRRRRPDSPNTAWRNASFQGYADHMLTEEFHAGLEALMALAQEDSCAIMCAEAVPWRCHRRLVADALLVRGYTVLEIISGATPKEHRLTPFAAVDGTRVTYPGTGDEADGE
ncbi:DUF488 family protein [Janibacter cremeus]|uniref:Uncharacterized protein (DUF488 family) n=1 Tax=Janibacter cremeus TaxID=1285192 RepID=A0A852VMD9_9MICO|nr:DUF488 domain-containing protein [Janibacter cremeus]NYF97089.1 uncharacterized protein (DUF488 family) [Janibacter cremeus]